MGIKLFYLGCCPDDVLVFCFCSSYCFALGMAAISAFWYEGFAMRLASSDCAGTSTLFFVGIPFFIFAGRR